MSPPDLKRRIHEEPKALKHAATRPLRVAIVDDHHIVRTGLREYLTEAHEQGPDASD